MLKLWCDNWGNVKNCAIDENTVCSQVKVIFEGLKEKAGEIAKDEKF